MGTGNEEQIEYWNGKAGETWVESGQRIDGLLEPISQKVLARADAQKDERVLDVGCGCGTTSLALASGGAAVWGLDISGPMLAYAKQRAEGLENVAFSQGDAASQKLTPDHDLIFSRFGVMFFADPVAAFSNLRSGLAPGGRLCFVCWQSPKENAWVSVAGKAVAPILAEAAAASGAEPAAPPDPRAPGPFAFADEAYLSSILEEAGFTEIGIESLTATLNLGADVDTAMQFQSEIGPVARALAELEGEPRDRALAAAREALEKHLTDAGIELGAACWLVTARGAA